jgi:hypothetical protein
MVKELEVRALSRPSALTSHGAALISARTRPGPHSAAARPTKPASVGHPGFAESLIPVWGSGREAVADYQEGD